MHADGGFGCLSIGGVGDIADVVGLCRCFTLLLAKFAILGGMTLPKVMMNTPDFLVTVLHHLMRFTRSRRFLAPVLNDTLTLTVRAVLLVLCLLGVILTRRVRLLLGRRSGSAGTKTSTKGVELSPLSVKLRLQSNDLLILNSITASTLKGCAFGRWLWLGRWGSRP